MKWFATTLVALSVFLAPQAKSQPEQPESLSEQLTGKRILHVGVHQDDEGIFALTPAPALNIALSR